MKQFINTIRVGYFLAVAQIKRAGKVTTILTIAVMVFSFLAQVFITGILIGLIEGSSVAFRAKFIGDAIISPLDKKEVIERTYDISKTLESNPNVAAYSVRYSGNAKLVYNDGTGSASDSENSITAIAYGIIPSHEDKTNKISENIIEGEYLLDGDPASFILVGSDLLDRYSNTPDVLETLSNVYPGSKIKLTISGKTEEFTVKGITEGKVDSISRGVFMKQEALKRMTGNTTSDANNSIAIRAIYPGAEYQIKQDLLSNNFDTYAKIETYEEGEPAFVKDLKKLFGVLGTMFGSITLFVAAITVYIVISINTLTRRKYIGILKGIGIRGGAIELAYVIQSFLYAVIGIVVGSIIIFAGIKPFFDRNPIDFPFSDGILVATIPSTATKAAILLGIAIVAAYFASRSTIRQNTLDAILGRNPAKKIKVKKSKTEVASATEQVIDSTILDTN
jgi:ABC-type lipoprotein release transport system permease subunit